MGTWHIQSNAATVWRAGLCADAMCWACRKVSGGHGLMAQMWIAMHHLTAPLFLWRIDVHACRN